MQRRSWVALLAGAVLGWCVSRRVARTRSGVRRSKPPRYAALHETCSRETDIWTMEPFAEVEDLVQIQFPGRDKLECYDRAALRYWLTQANTKFAKWKAKPGRTLDAQGRGGAPDHAHPYYKLPLGDYTVFIDANAYTLLTTHDAPYFQASLITKSARIGNWAGTFGVSELHGQLPGETVYTLRAGKETKATQKKKEAKLMGMVRKGKGVVPKAVLKANVQDNRFWKRVLERAQGTQHAFAMDWPEVMKELEEEGFFEDFRTSWGARCGPAFLPSGDVNWRTALAYMDSVVNDWIGEFWDNLKKRYGITDTNTDIEVVYLNSDDTWHDIFH